MKKTMLQAFLLILILILLTLMGLFAFRNYQRILTTRQEITELKEELQEYESLLNSDTEVFDSAISQKEQFIEEIQQALQMSDSF